MTRKLLLVSSILLLASIPRAAHAWGDGGHEMVAAIAYSRLHPHAKAEVDRILALAVDPSAPSRATAELRFWHAAHYPDDVRGDLPDTASEHYYDLPFHGDRTRLPNDLPKKVNAVEALQRYTTQLTTGTDAEKAFALRFVIHIVGDIHQPLHCATRVTREHQEGDRGGNDFKITVVDENGRTHTAKLHSFWDGGLGTFPKEGQNFSPPPDDEIQPAVASALRNNRDTDPKLGLNGQFDKTTFEKWAKESEQLAESIAYADLSPGDEPDDDYVKQGVLTARKRVAWAGYRLAALLNAIWP